MPPQPPARGTLLLEVWGGVRCAHWGRVRRAHWGRVRCAHWGRVRHAHFRPSGWALSHGQSIPNSA